MKRLVTREDVAAYLKATASADMEAHITTGEWIVAQELGASSLHARSVYQRHVLLYDLAPDESLLLRDGPAASFDPDSTGSQLLLDGVEISTANVVLDPWSIREQSTGFLKGVLEMRLTLGWTPANVPENVKQAIIMSAGTLFKHPDQSVLMERIGDYTRQSASLVAAEVAASTPQVRLLLRGWRRPRV